MAGVEAGIVEVEGEVEGEGYAFVGVCIMPPHGGGADAAAEAEDGDGGLLPLLLPGLFALPVFKLGQPFERVVYGGEVGDFDLVVQEEVCQPPGLHVFVEAVGAGGAGDFVVGFLFLAHDFMVGKEFFGESVRR